MIQSWDGRTGRWTDGWMIRAGFINLSSRAEHPTKKTWNFYIIKYNNTLLLYENFCPNYFWFNQTFRYLIQWITTSEVHSELYQVNYWRIWRRLRCQPVTFFAKCHLRCLTGFWIYLSTLWFDWFSRIKLPFMTDMLLICRLKVTFWGNRFIWFALNEPD